MILPKVKVNMSKNTKVIFITFFLQYFDELWDINTRKEVCIPLQL